MNEPNPTIRQMAARHLEELAGAIDQAVKEGAGWEVILSLKAAARAYRQVLKHSNPSTPTSRAAHRRRRGGTQAIPAGA